MTKFRIRDLTSEEFLALGDAVVLGALADRQKALCMLIEANSPSQLPDQYERELQSLRRAAHAIVHAEVLG